MPDAIPGATYRDKVHNLDCRCLAVRGNDDNEPVVDLQYRGFSEKLTVDLEAFRNDDSIILLTHPEQ